MTGDLYLPEQSAIYLGDAFELLKSVRPGSVDLILTDPPSKRAVDMHDLRRRSRA